MSENIVISGISAITSVGGNAAQTCTAIHAKIIGVGQHSLYRCKPLYPGEEKAFPLFCSQVPFIAEEQVGAERLLQLAVPALREVVADAKLDTTELAYGKLLLALPERDTVTATWRLEDAFVPSLCQRAGIYPIAQWQVKFGGRTSVFELLAEACQALEQDECEFCIVGGVDSFLFKHRLEELDQNWSLRSKKNVDGFIPGEAAGFIFVEKMANANRRGLSPLAQINALAFAEELNSAETGRKSSGVGLTNAVQQVATGNARQFATVYSDLNGESYLAFEWGLAQVRALDHLGSAFELLHPAECYGDVGAATGALLLTLAAYDLRPKEYTPPKRQPVLLFASSHNKDARAAASLSAIE
jgi:3-oxoacyl-[acyl-carrier-protein] synthase I